MKTELKSVLHLYMGCDFVTANSRGNVNPKTLHMILKHWASYTNFQLVLRRLDSMTEEEAKEIEATKAFQRPSPVHQIGMMVWTAESYRLLLAKGFDLYDLIKNGFAIDKATL